MTMTETRPPEFTTPSSRRPTASPRGPQKSPWLGRALTWVVLLLAGVALGLAVAPADTITKAIPAAPEAAIGEKNPRTVDGVRLGYERSEEGAIAAATHFASIISTTMMLNDAQRTAAIAALAHPEYVDALQARMRSIVRNIERGLNVGVGEAKGTYWVAPVGYRVDSYSPDEATISMWAASAATLGPIEPRAGWATSTVRLGWVDGDWRVLEESATPGPTPQPSTDTPTPPVEFEAIAGSFTGYSYAP